jgi:NADH:ubiquinone oxidoreductase subunit F (NADH-binding)/NADH:ubiquinone oxidoreductase subunit E
VTLKTDKIIEIVDAIVARRGTTRDSVIPILQDIQSAFNYLPGEAMQQVCNKTEITASQITGIATFYSQFRLEQAGKHIIRVCTGTACHVKGASRVYDALARELKLSENQVTDSEGLFTLEKVACLGCCTLAPVVKIDEITFGHVQPEGVGNMLRDFLSKSALSKSEKVTNSPAILSVSDEIRIGLGSCCVASGSEAVKLELEKVLSETGISVAVKQVGCVGVCNQVPMLEIVSSGESKAFYSKVEPSSVREIVLSHFKPKGIFRKMKNSVVSRFEKAVEIDSPVTYTRYLADARETPISEFLGPQLSIASENRGVLHPCDIDEYRAGSGFEALKKCLETYSPGQVVEIVQQSGLRGRGGAGFLSGRKWELVNHAGSEVKYVICNGDEGDPGAFMDRMLLESYPYRVIEGMLIAGFATGATEGIFYIRAEYPLAVRRIEEALQVCRDQQIVGKSVLGSKFTFDIRVFEGAGAFVCGEETALIASIEGNRGIPRMRPPYPAMSGLWGKPTLVNNTETLSMVPWIVKHGADQFASIGTQTSKGTKVFALAGKVNRGGLIEVPMGITLRQIVDEIGGGIAFGKKFKAVQIGGPSGGCIPAEHYDLPVDFDKLVQAGAMMGSGGLIVLDETDCMVDIAHYFLSFTKDQSCGRCTFCRIGTARMLNLLDKIRQGKAAIKDIDELESLALSTQKGSLCGLGKTAPNPVLSTLRYFRNEYEAHINGHCPAGKCQPLIQYSINTHCIGCTKCAQRCPTGAIKFTPYQLHSIETDLCIKCDICRQICPVDAVDIK